MERSWRSDYFRAKISFNFSEFNFIFQISFTQYDGEQIDFLGTGFFLLYFNVDFILFVVVIGEEEAAIVGFVFELATTKTAFFRNLRNEVIVERLSARHRGTCRNFRFRIYMKPYKQAR